jgi:hypothetical protein
MAGGADAVIAAANAAATRPRRRDRDLHAFDITSSCSKHLAKTRSKMRAKQNLL